MRHLVLFTVIIATVLGPAAVSLGMAGAATAGGIRGRVMLRQVVSAPSVRPNVAGLGAPITRDEEDRRRSVVYLESAPRGAFDQVEAGHAVMDQKNETFVPHVLAVTTGTTVDFRNSDHIFHNVFSLSKASRFDLGRYALGKSKAVRFDHPGIVRVFCDIHSHMSAFVLVFNHPFFTTTDAEGRYHLDNIPPGNYSVVAWNEGVSSDPKPVAVPDGGSAELDITLR
jgi:plastocyanin